MEIHRVDLRCLILLVFGMFTLPQAAELPGKTGVVIPEVVSLSDPDMSYALYLPTTYTNDRLWPVLVCLDPGARGTVPVERFHQAAEKYGFIVIGSNNARNYDARSVERALTAILGDLGARYSIHAKGVFGAGFSGGARVALSLAANSGLFQGVIACGAGFHPQFPPNPFDKFPVLYTLGNLDSNYCSMRSQYMTLRKFGRDTGMILFDGPHQWPSAQVCDLALGWLRIRAMALGALKQDLQWHWTFAEQCADSARGLLDQGKPLQALCMAQLVSEEQAVEESVMIRIRSMLQDPRILSAVQQENTGLEWERDQLREIEGMLSMFKRPVLDVRERSRIREWFRTQQRLYDRLIEDSDPMKARASERMADFLWRRPTESMLIELADGRDEQAVRYGELAAVLRPDDWTVHYNLACGYARLGELRKSFGSIEESVQKGLKDPERIWSDPDLADLRKDRKYKEKLNRLLGREVR